MIGDVFYERPSYGYALRSLRFFKKGVHFKDFKFGEGWIIQKLHSGNQNFCLICSFSVKRAPLKQKLYPFIEYRILNFWLSDVSHCVLQTNLRRIRLVYIFKIVMNSTFTWALPNKSFSGLHCYKIFGNIIDCVWPAPWICQVF